MFGIRLFEMMKPTAIILNDASSGITDTDVIMLEYKRINGTAFDVLEAEPLGTNDSLVKTDNVVLSTNTAGMTFEGKGRLVRKASQNAVDVLECRKLYKGLLNEGVINRTC